MKQKSPLAVYLHRLEAARKELQHRKHHVVDSINILDSLYTYTIATNGIPHQRLDNERECVDGKCPPENPHAKPVTDILGKGSCGSHGVSSSSEQRQNAVQEICFAYNHHRRRLNETVTFLKRKSTELARIKRNFQNEYPLTLKEPVERDLLEEEIDTGELIHEEDLRKKKDAAVLKMRVSLKKLESAVTNKLDAKDVQELEEFCNALRDFQAGGSDRGRSETRKTARMSVASQQRKADDTAMTPSARSRSFSKERLLIKAKHVLAAKLTASRSDVPSGLKAPFDQSANESVEQFHGHLRGEPELPLMSFCQISQGLPRLDDVDFPAGGSKFWAEGQDRSAVPERRHQLKPIREVASTARGRSKLEVSSSVGEWYNESSLLTLSTVSATLGDSSLQISDCIGGKLTDTDSSALPHSSSDFMESSVGGECWSKKDFSSQDESAELSTNSDGSSRRGRSRYIHVGLTEQQQDPNKSDLYRPPHLRGNRLDHPARADCYDVPPRHRGAFPTRRSQSYHRQRAEQGGCFSRESDSLPERRAQSSHPPSRHISREEVSISAQHQNRLAERSQSSQSLSDFSRPKHHEKDSTERSQPSQRIADFSNSKSTQNPNSFAEQSHPSRSLVEDHQHVVTVTRFHQAGGDYGKEVRRTTGSTSGCSSGESIASSTSRRGSEDSFDCDLKDMTTEEEVTSKGRKEREMVVVKLVRMEDIQRHRGPGLMDTAKQTDSFVFHKERTLQELSDFTHSRMGINNRGRLRLWLFEEDDGGMYLPRRMLKGPFVSNTLGSLNRSTVTLFVQMAERQERLFSLHQNNVRFVFVKAPSSATGNFVVKGHHNVDVSKATRAVIQVLKRKFMPDCKSPLKLFVEMGGSKMMVVPHSPISILKDDTGNDTRHGDVFVLLEDFIGHDSLFSDVSSGSSNDQSHRGCSFIAPLSPHHALKLAREHSSYDLDPCSHTSKGQPDGDDVFFSDQGCHDVASDVEAGNDVTHDEKKERSDDACDARGVEIEIDGLEEGPKKDAERMPPPALPVEGPKRTTSVNQYVKKFVIPNDCATSTSDESLAPTSPVNQKSSNTRPPFPPWDLTNHYLSRFHDNRYVKKESEAQVWQQRREPVKVTEGQTRNTKVSEGQRKGQETSFAEMNSDTSGVDCVEYDESVLMFSRPDFVDSARYDSISAGDAREESTFSSSSLWDSHFDASVRSEQTPLARIDESTRVQTSACGQNSDCGHGLRCGSSKSDVRSVSRINGKNVTDRRPNEAQEMTRGRVEYSVNGQEAVEYSRAQRRVSGRLVPSGQEEWEGKCPRQGSEETVGSCTTTAKSILKVADTMKGQLPAGHPGIVDTNPNSNKGAAEGGSERQQQRNLNSAGSYGTSSQSDKGAANQRSSNLTPITPQTPYSAVSDNSVFLSDDAAGEEEEPSVYYTPRPAFVFPDREPRLQSTALPATEEEGGGQGLSLQLSHLHLHPDQISAITNRSSSFMAVRLPPSHPQARLPPHQISAITNISSSFMDIPYNPFESLPSHSASFSGRDGQCYHSDSSFPVITPLLQDRMHNDTSYNHEGRRTVGNAASSHSSAQERRQAPPSTIKKKLYNAQNGPSHNQQGYHQNWNRQYQHQNEPFQSQEEAPQKRNVPFQNQRELAQNGNGPFENGYDPSPNSSQQIHPVLESGKLQEHLFQQLQQHPQQQQQQQQQQHVRRSQASLVKQEDPAIMHVGKRVLHMAHRSSLNAQAMEFVPKAPGFNVLSTVPELACEEQEGEALMNGGQPGAASAQSGEQDHRMWRGGRTQAEGQMKRPLPAQLPPPVVNPSSQHTALPNHRPPQGTRPGSHFPQSSAAGTGLSRQPPPRLQPNTTSFSHQSNLAPYAPLISSQQAVRPTNQAALRSAQPPAMLPHPSGMSYPCFPPRLCHVDDSRHVTFADQSQHGSVGVGVGRQDLNVMAPRVNQPSHSGHLKSTLDHKMAAQFSIPVQHPPPTHHPTSNQHCVSTEASLLPQVPRKRIGSGRFDERSRHPTAEAPGFAQQSAQREGPQQYNNMDHCYRQAPHGHIQPTYAHSTEDRFDNARRDNFNSDGKRYSNAENNYSNVDTHSNRAESYYRGAGSHQGRDQHCTSNAESYRNSTENFHSAGAQRISRGVGWPQGVAYAGYGRNAAPHNGTCDQSSHVHGGQQGKYCRDQNQGSAQYQARFTTNHPSTRTQYNGVRGSGEPWRQEGTTRRPHNSGTVPAAYRQPRSSAVHYQTNSAPYGENGESNRDDVYSGEGQAWRWNRNTARAPPARCDQYDISCQSNGTRYANPQQFRQASKPNGEAESRVGSGATTLQSATSNRGQSGAEVTSKSGNDAIEKTQNETQTSSAAKPPLRVRRGYIQLGLSEYTRPQLLRSVSDPSQ